MTNDRLQMLVRLKLEALRLSSQTHSIDYVIITLAGNWCAPEFLYDAVTALRHDGQIEIIAADGVKVAILTEKGSRILDFDKQILIKIAEIINEQESAP